MPSLAERIAAINDLVCAASVLNWDARTMMPAGGAAVRGGQIATLIGVARELLCSDETQRALEAEEEHLTPGCDPHARAGVAAVRRAMDLHRKVPAAVLARRAALKPRATAAWALARESSDVSIFLPHLKETIAAARDYAAAVGGEHPCDPLIDLHEPGETNASLGALLNRLREGLAPILASADRHRADALPPWRGRFPLDAQRAVSIRFAERFGFDFERGRLDTTRHPFETAFTRNDVRITTRYREDDPTTALFGTLHETGHGLYEQNIDPALTRSALATDLVSLYPMGGTGSGVHESQSRLYENHIGRSQRFWELHFGELQQAFPGALDDLDAVAFHRRVTRVSPSLIRTESDELTYDFHIFVRFGLEAALMTGDLEAAELPGAWSEAMRAALGVAPQSDALGCLQDVHWAVGEFGSFASYTVGNIMAAQLMETACTQATVTAGLESGHYGPLADWLRQNVWRHARLYTRDELLTRATGSPLRVEPYLHYLERKYVAPAGAERFS